MAAESSVQSNANSFTSSMRSGVDPRTGLYKISISLPDIQTNDLRGPGFGMGLSYSPLNTMDSGYGMGWNLQLSQYNPDKHILSLSTGESFKVTGSAGTQLVMKEKKIDSFHFYQMENDDYRVVHKSGVVEVLKVFGSSQNRIALPVEIHSMTGHKITFEYATFSGSHQILKSIKDDSGETLLSVKRESASIEVLLRPFAGPSGDPLARFVMTLEGSDRYVSKIILPNNEASWRFGYRIENEQLCISSVETPAGGREEILYQDLGHQFPVGSGRKPLPRVTGHRTFPGSGQPEVDVRFTYPEEKNFLGHGLSLAWDDDGLDNLYKNVTDYTYHCVETLWADDKPVRKIEREFNRFHLLTKERTTQNNNVQTIDTTYFLTPNVSFEEQPTYCQLPKEVKTTWSLLDNVTRQRSETVSSTYDTHGNVLTQTQANGVVETSTWFPAADANDFVRHVKERTVTPPPSANGNAPTLSTRYTYTSLPPLTGSSLTNWTTTESETLVQLGTSDSDEIELQCTRYNYTDDPDDAFLHGRVERQTLIMNNTSSFIDYQYSRLDSPQLDVPVLQATQTLSSDFDNASKAITQQYSLLTSQELLSLDGDVETRFTYDALNRLTSEIVAYGTANEARRQYAYTLSAASGDQASQVITNARQVKTRTTHDGLGRAILVERDHVDSDAPGVYRRTSSALYNARGDLAQNTEYDRLDGKELASTTRFEYDDWAQLCTATGPDGVERHQRNDPIGTDDSMGPITRSWLQSAGPEPSISAISETWLNSFGKPTRTRVLDAAEKEVSFVSYKYDGLGRCTETSDAYKRITRFTYDVFSRVINSSLANGDIVERDFVAHSTQELPVALRVIGNGTTYAVGEQDFDSLERLTRLQTGERTERYAYEGGQMQVHSKTTPANDAITYEYNRRLTDQPVSSHAPDETADFTYDPTSARLTRAKNEQGAREYGYDATNQLLSEHWIDKKGQPWDTLYSSSMRGRLLKRTDLQQEGTGGLETVHHYDALGRLESIDQGQLQATFEYNKLGQLCKTTTTDLAAGSVMITELEYDNQGREILRTLTQNQKPPRIQEQTWLLDGQLESRHLQQGAVSLLKEIFEYDARGRLTNHKCSGITLPRDSEGRAITEQIFTFNAVDSVTLVMTSFAGSTTERARFFYAVNDACLLEKVTYTPPRMTGDPTFAYDLNGNQLNDERGQKLSYDSQNRLLKVESAAGQIVNEYGYDSNDHLVTSQEGNQESTRFYQDLQLSAVVKDAQQVHFLYNQGQPLGQQQAGDASKNLLLQTDANYSVVGESQQDQLRTSVYSAYGERHSDDAPQSLLAFNGELRDPASGWYLLGKGYRAYNPALMRFHSADSHSPFGSGGVNPYSYCLGNPIALRDPTGHEAIGWSGRLRRPDEDTTPGMSGGGGGDWLGWLFVGIGAVAAVALTVAAVVTAGAATPLAGAAFALTIAKASALTLAAALSVGATAAQAVSLANGDEEAGKWGLYLGLASLVPSVGAGVFGSIAKVVGNGLDDIVRNAARYSTGTMWGFGPSNMHEFPVNRIGLIPRPTFTYRPPTGAGNPAPASAPVPPAPALAPASALPQLTASASARPAVNAADLVKQMAKLKAPKPVAPAQSAKPDELLAAIAARRAGLTVTHAVTAGKSAGSTSAFFEKAQAKNLNIRT